MGKLRIGILDLLTNKMNDAWFEKRVMLPNFGSSSKAGEVDQAA